MMGIDDLLKPLQDDEEKEELKITIEAYKIVESCSEEFLFKNVKSYTDVCKYLKEPSESDPYLQLKQIAKLFNGGWKPKFNDSQDNWYPYFRYIPGDGLVYDRILKDNDDFLSAVFYYKNESIATYIGKTFVNIYKNLSESY